MNGHFYTCPVCLYEECLEEHDYCVNCGKMIRNQDVSTLRASMEKVG